MVDRSEEAKTVMNHIPYTRGGAGRDSKQTPKKTNLPSSSVLQNFLKLINRGNNYCFVNGVIQLLDVTEIKTFLVSKLPLQKRPEIATAQELARLYRATGERESAEHLLR